ncbi:protein-disulfide reductase DsbD [Atopomonas sediminilitoris]|uniref:protein-disulfide reductase DsbD n=1 Tax=Atopomonas sediminilitoris TaxID=2919919 RepID=UPI001F4E290F|nr:protein-disulfide reductase DsbD [Atopomonas sediminilitoris]MCJ8170163.1 protein-disulfide reductase DsbD [Atopomonas sediminilitoris]
MSRLLVLLLLGLFNLSGHANLFDNRPSSLLGAPANNQADFLPVDQAFQVELYRQSDTRLTLRFINADAYYLYRHRFNFSTNNTQVTLGTPALPAGQAKTDEYFGDVEVYYGITDVSMTVSNPDQLPFTLNVSYQGCADKGLCYPPETKRFDISQSSAAPITSNTRNTSASEPASPLWQGVLLAFLAGLGLTFTPCVLPMLPILSGVVLRGHPSRLRGLALSTAYVLPMAMCFAVLGALMGSFGAELNLQARLQSPWVLIPFALFFALFAIAMFGVFELRLPAFIREPLDRQASHARGGSLLGAATLGVLSSLLVSPCVTAPMAGLLLYISLSGDALGGALQLFALGLGMGVPLLVVGAGGSALLPKSGAWMVAVRNVFGVMLLAVAIWLLERLLPGPAALALWGLLAAGVALFLGALEFGAKNARQKLAQLLGLALLVYALASWIGALQGASDPLRPLAPSHTSLDTPSASQGQWQTITTAKELTTALKRASDQQQAVLLDWYADWCISCKIIEREVLEHPEIAPRLATLLLLRLDLTDNTAEQRQLLAQHQLFGPPALQFFDAQGDELRDLRVIGEIERAAFARLLDRREAGL